MEAASAPLFEGACRRVMVTVDHDCDEVEISSTFRCDQEDKVDDHDLFFLKNAMPEADAWVRLHRERTFDGISQCVDIRTTYKCIKAAPPHIAFKPIEIKRGIASAEEVAGDIRKSIEAVKNLYLPSSADVPEGRALQDGEPTDADIASLFMAREDVVTFSVRSDDLDEVMANECRHAISLLPRWPRCIPCDVPLEIAHFGMSGSHGTGVWCRCPKGCLIEQDRTCSFTAFKLSARAARLMAGRDTWTAPRFRRH